jgi:hypothetical protein
MGDLSVLGPRSSAVSSGSEKRRHLERFELDSLVALQDHTEQIAVGPDAGEQRDVDV